jgi:predicted N-formylglutamate amidohydrolase
MLATHSGYDIGALKLYEDFVAAGADAAFFSETSRLLVELNRSRRHPNLFSIATKDLPDSEKASYPGVSLCTLPASCGRGNWQFY